MPGAKVFLFGGEAVRPTLVVTPAPLDAAPAAGAAAVLVQSVPSGADILREGERLGATPLLVKLPPGVHLAELTLRKPGYLEERRMVHPELEPKLTVRLQPQPPPPPPLPPAPTPHASARAGAGSPHGPRPGPTAAPEPAPAGRKAAPRPAVGGDDIIAPSF